MTAIARVGAMVLRMPCIVRAPIWLYRARLGFLLGERFLMLEHLGRITGARRYAVLEVVDHSSPSRYVVASGFGERAQWFRNVMANPSVRIFVGAQAPWQASATRLNAPDVSVADTGERD